MDLNVHHKGLSRIRAEQLLQRDGRDGSFLVRDSESTLNAFTLCVLFEGHVTQYRIIRQKDGQMYVMGEVVQRKYSDLKQLLHELVHKGTVNGLVCALKYPIVVAPCTEQDDGYSSVGPVATDPDVDLAVFDDSTSSNTNTNILSNLVHQRFSKLNLSGQPGDFVTALKEYADRGIEDDYQAFQSVRHNPHVDGHVPQLKCLKKLVTDASDQLYKAAQDYLDKLELCELLFGSDTKCNEQTSQVRSMERLSDTLSKCQRKWTSLDQRAKSTFTDLPEHLKRSKTLMLLPQKSVVNLAPAEFDVKVAKLGKGALKYKLTIDFHKGEFIITKAYKDPYEVVSSHKHGEIEQLIKSTKKRCNLDIKVLSQKKETYIFESMRCRESFCQMTQKLKMLHSCADEIDNISIFIGTWNMANEPPPSMLKRWLLAQGKGKTCSPEMAHFPHDVYVIGTQESAMSEKEWVTKLKNTLQDELHCPLHTVSYVKLWELRLVILVKDEHRNVISHVQHSTVKTGIANALGNKGAVGVSFQFNGTSLCFVNCHLTSGDEKNSRRNQNVRDILKGLALGSKSLQSNFDITHRFQHLFVLGDLNYRLDHHDGQQIIQQVSDENQFSEPSFASLLAHDQLSQSRKKKDVFCGFEEDEITFPPTYKFYKNSNDNYDWQKVKATTVRINVPSWCDRILWKSYPMSFIKNLSYGMVETISTSDHKPVFATFNIGIKGQFVPQKQSTKQQQRTVIVFQKIVANFNTITKDNFKIKFHSTCLEEAVSSKKNYQFFKSDNMDMKVKQCCPIWEKNEIPHLVPIVGDEEYLEDQHILLAMQTADEMESYGECVISLKGRFSSKPLPFTATLTHTGEETGIIQGLMHVQIKTGSASTERSRRIYEIVCLDTDLGNIPDGEYMPIPETSNYRSITDINSVTSGNYQLPTVNLSTDRTQHLGIESPLREKPKTSPRPRLQSASGIMPTGAKPKMPTPTGEHGNRPYFLPKYKSVDSPDCPVENVPKTVRPASNDGVLASNSTTSVTTRKQNVPSRSSKLYVYDESPMDLPDSEPKPTLKQRHKP